MNRAPMPGVNVPVGLDATLQMLQSWMASVSVEREYQPNLPLISSYGAELNKVSTALIDNALGAIAETDRPGVLRIICRTEGEVLLVEIDDNGSSIPVDLQGRIFGLFFTKPPGHALGIGLDNAMRIVRKHRGHLGVRPEPGFTCFRVRLPFSQFEAY
jgi:signal transduction histidine kinase